MVYNLRQRAFQKIRTYYELQGRGAPCKLTYELVQRAVWGEDDA